MHYDEVKVTPRSAAGKRWRAVSRICDRESNPQVNYTEDNYFGLRFEKKEGSSNKDMGKIMK
jgi:hypothetical protein